MTNALQKAVYERKINSYYKRSGKVFVNQFHLPIINAHHNPNEMGTDKRIDGKNIFLKGQRTKVDHR